MIVRIKIRPKEDRIQLYELYDIFGNNKYIGVMTEREIKEACENSDKYYIEHWPKINSQGCTTLCLHIPSYKPEEDGTVVRIVKRRI
jgi:hypothetical protein